MGENSAACAHCEQRVPAYEGRLAPFWTSGSNTLRQLCPDCAIAYDRFNWVADPEVVADA